ncbi:MAG: dephospho-CoA kinase [Bacteroidia bacterium]|nr:dephospho-CoA kinase [Bacteroidia bacterium]
MAKVIGLTGGIGSGKSTVARFFQLLDVPVYNSDERAKWLIENNTFIRNGLVRLLGEETFVNNVYNRSYVAAKVFNNTSLLNEINSLVHPQVAEDFAVWTKQQQNTYVIKEAAILFESGAYKQCHQTIFISAPKELRIKRVSNRSGLTKQAIEERMKNQLPEEEKQKRANFILINDDKQLLIPQILKLHTYFTQFGFSCFTM